MPPPRRIPKVKNTFDDQRPLFSCVFLFFFLLVFCFFLFFCLRVPHIWVIFEGFFPPILFFCVSLQFPDDLSEISLRATPWISLDEELSLFLETPRWQYERSLPDGPSEEFVSYPFSRKPCPILKQIFSSVYY